MTGRNKKREASGKDRLAAWARAGRVIHQDDWYHSGADGGSPIKAVRSRISELEQDGYRFHHTVRPDGTVEYRLAHYTPARIPAVEAPVDVDADPAEQLPLLDRNVTPGLEGRWRGYDWDGDE